MLPHKLNNKKNLRAFTALEKYYQNKSSSVQECKCDLNWKKCIHITYHLNL